jgi:hypothetical protein
VSFSHAARPSESPKSPKGPDALRRVVVAFPYEIIEIIETIRGIKVIGLLRLSVPLVKTGGIV